MIRLMKAMNHADEVIALVDEYKNTQGAREQADAEALWGVIRNQMPAGTVDRLIVLYLEWERDTSQSWRTEEQMQAMQTVIDFHKARYEPKKARQGSSEAQAGDEPS